MKDTSHYRMTTFQLSENLHTQLKIMCVLTKKSMSQFIRVAITDKINELKKQEVK